MPIPIPCPGCNKRLRVPETVIGKSIKCPACTFAFVAADPSASVQEEPNPFAIPEEHSRSPFQTDTANNFEALAPEAPGQDKREMPQWLRAAWYRTRIGVDLLLLKVLLNVFVIILLAGVGAYLHNYPDTLDTPSRFRTPKPSEEESTNVPAFLVKSALVVALLTVLLGHTVSTAGLAFCINAPSEEGAKSLAVLAFVLAASNLFSYCLASGLSYGGEKFEQPIIAGAGLAITVMLGYYGPAFWLLETILILLFLRACAASLRAPGVGASAVGQVVLVGLLPAGMSAVIVGFALIVKSRLDMFRPGQRMSPDMVGNFAGATLVGLATAAGLVLIWAIWYVASVVQVRLLISRRLNRGMP